MSTSRKSEEIGNGKNLDTTWNVLTGWVETPVTLIWNNYEAGHKQPGDYTDKVLKMFKDAEREVTGFQVLINL